MRRPGKEAEGDQWARGTGGLGRQLQPNQPCQPTTALAAPAKAAAAAAHNPWRKLAPKGCGSGAAVTVYVPALLHRTCAAAG